MRQYFAPQFNAPGIPCGARVVTCHTENCENSGVALEFADDGSMVFCGPCGFEITDCVAIPNSNPHANALAALPADVPGLPLDVGVHQAS